MTNSNKLADALDCFWNAALDGTRSYDDATANAVMSGMVQGFAAVAARLREPDAAPLAAPPAQGEGPEFPPLPSNPAVVDPGRFGVAYSADQMRTYARETIAYDSAFKNGWNAGYNTAIDEAPQHAPAPLQVYVLSELADEIDLDALRAALAAGPTPGPWQHDLETYGSEADITMWAEGENYVVNIGYASNPVDANGHCIAFDGSKTNATYIAACDPTTIGALVDELSARRARDAEVGALVRAATAVLSHNPAHYDTDEEASLRAALLPFQRSDDKGETP